MKKRVVVTGLGTINPVGNNVDDFWAGIKAGKNGIGQITRFDTEGFATTIAGEVRDFDPTLYMDRKEMKKLDLFSVYAVASSMDAVKDAGIKEGDIDPEKMGVILGNGIGGFETIEEGYEKMLDRGPRRLPVMTVPKMLSNLGPGNVAIALNAQGPCYTVVTACASGTDAIGDAARWIESGVCDIMVAGGVEAPITKLGVAGFNVIQALSTRNDSPETASRPFDKNRDGFVMAEGAGILILEEYEHAVKRGAKIYCELAGYGISCDANHITAPHPEGKGAVQAIKMALSTAGIKPEDIDYINAHGTSTPLNDKTETISIKKAFGDHAYKLKVSSTKSQTGHCLGAAGGVEAVASILAIRDQWAPPTMNYETADPECDLDYIPNKGIDLKIDYAMSSSLGFGGHNGILIFKKL